jgi:hypothetical protein
MLMLEPVGLASPAADAVYGSLSPLCLDTRLIDWQQEMARLALPEYERRGCSALLDARTKGDEDEHNRFQVAARCYHAAQANAAERSELDRFLRTAHGREIEATAQYLAVAQLMGRPPAGLQEISTLANDPRQGEKQRLYTGVYDYMQRVAYRQLKGGVEQAHRSGVRIGFDFPAVAARQSPAVLYHAACFADGTPHAGGMQRPDLALLSGIRSGDDPWAAALAFLVDEFEFDGTVISGLTAYEGPQGGGASSRSVLSRLVFAARSVRPDILIVAEPFADTEAARYLDIYTAAGIATVGQLNALTGRAPEAGKLWPRVVPGEDRLSPAYTDLCRAVVRTGLSDYISFPLQDGTGRYFDIMSFIQTIFGEVNAAMHSMYGNDPFAEGYGRGTKLPGRWYLGSGYQDRVR